MQNDKLYQSLQYWHPYGVPATLFRYCSLIINSTGVYLISLSYVTCSTCCYTGNSDLLLFPPMAWSCRLTLWAKHKPSRLDLPIKRIACVKDVGIDKIVLAAIDASVTQNTFCQSSMDGFSLSRHWWHPALALIQVLKGVALRIWSATVNYRYQELAYRGSPFQGFWGPSSVHLQRSDLYCWILLDQCL